MAYILINEAAQAYHVPMNTMRRSVIFVRDPGFFVIIDKIEASGSQHKYSWRIHLNNKDDKGILKNMSQCHWHFSRPLANLDIYLFSDQEVTTDLGKGYLHGPGRDYSPGGVYEGSPGSSIELEAFNTEKSQSLTDYSVLFPSKQGTRTPAVEFSGNKMTVGKDILTFSEGECVIRKGGKSENYRLW